MLANKVILYDDSCPMCKVYTQGFVRMGILAPDHRVGMARANAETMSRLDLNRARHEIPLLDTQTGEVTYGMDALFLLIGHRFPIFTPFFRSAIFRSLVYALYQLVSYNRRVIAGCAPPREGFDCAPDFNRAARMKYLRIAIAGWGLLIGGTAIATGFAHQGLLLALVLTVASIQAVRFGKALRGHCFWDRAGSYATNNLLFGLLLTPALLPLPAPLRWLNFGIAIAVTALDAIRRQRNCRRCLSKTRICRETRMKASQNFLTRL